MEIDNEVFPTTANEPVNSANQTFPSEPFTERTSGRWNSLRQVAQAFFSRHDNISDVQMFESRMLMYSGLDAYLSTSDRNARRRNVETSARIALEVSSTFAGSVAGGLIGGAVGSGVAGPPGGFIGVRVGQARGANLGHRWGQYRFENEVRPLVNRCFPDQDQAQSRKYDKVFHDCAELPDRVWNSQILTPSETIAELSTIKQNYLRIADSFDDADPTIAKAIRDYVNLEIDKKIEYYEQFTSEIVTPANLSINMLPTSAGRSANRRRETVPLSESDRQLVSHFLAGYGSNPNQLDPRSQFMIAEIARQEAELREQAKAAESFQFLNDAFGMLGMLGEVSGNQKLMQIAEVGGKVVGIMKSISELPGTIAAANTPFAAIQPVMGLAMAVFSLGGLFRRKRGGNGMQAIMGQLQQISSQIAALHRDVIEGFNMLAEGQRLIFNTMTESFARLARLIQSERAEIVVPMMESFARIEQSLSLLNQQLNTRFDALNLKSFEKLLYVIEETISSLKDIVDEAEARHTLNGLRRKMLKLENWIMNVAKSAHSNGMSFTEAIMRSASAHIEVEMTNLLLPRDDQDEQLSSFIAYLSASANQLLPDVFSIIKSKNLINPTIWEKGAKTYLQLRIKFKQYQINYDKEYNKLKTIKEIGENYLEFIDSIQQHHDPLFKALITKHQSYFKELRNETIKHYTQRLEAKLNLMERRMFKQQATYNYDEEYIRQNISQAALQQTVIEQFQTYENYIAAEIEAMQLLWHDKFNQLISQLLTSEIEHIDLEMFDRSFASLAKHKLGTYDGESYLETWHNPEHRARFEQNGLKLPFSLRKLFDGDEQLRNAIPKILFMAELLDIGHFEITFIAHYVGNGRFPGEGYQFLYQPPYGSIGARGYWYPLTNYKYEFALNFVSHTMQNNSADIKICEFYCYAEQIPMDDELRALALSLERCGQQMVARHAGIFEHLPMEYWVLGQARMRINAMAQIKKLSRVNSLTLALSEEKTRELTEQYNTLVKNRLNAIKTDYHQYFLTKDKRVLFANVFDKLEATRNKLLAFMRLRGYQTEQIMLIKSLCDILVNNFTSIRNSTTLAGRPVAQGVVDDDPNNNQAPHNVNLLAEANLLSTATSSMDSQPTTGEAIAQLQTNEKRTKENLYSLITHLLDSSLLTEQLIGYFGERVISLIELIDQELPINERGSKRTHESEGEAAKKRKTGSTNLGYLIQQTFMPPPSSANSIQSQLMEAISTWMAIINSLQDQNGSGQLNEQLKQQAAEFGFDCRNVAGDGNCFFHAIADQLQAQNFSLDNTGNNLDAATLRDRAVQHIIDNLNLYENFIETDLNDFILKISRGGEWADNIVIIALSRALNINIAIIRSDGANPTIIRRANPTLTVYLGYEVDCHYQSLSKNTELAATKDINYYIEMAGIDQAAVATAMVNS